jgi:hypothetical protein
VLWIGSFGPSWSWQQCPSGAPYDQANWIKLARNGGNELVFRHALRPSHGAPRLRTGRGLTVAHLAAASALLALHVHGLAAGAVSAGAFVVTIFLGAVTMGVVLALLIERFVALQGEVFGRRMRRTTKCHSCGHPMRLRHSIRVCPKCDRISAEQ